MTVDDLETGPNTLARVWIGDLVKGVRWSEVAEIAGATRVERSVTMDLLASPNLFTWLDR